MEGHFRALISIWEKEPWREVWKQLAVYPSEFSMD
jgi:hypothetical protein